MENKERFEPEHRWGFEYPKESTPGNMQTYGDLEKGNVYDVYKLIALAETMPEETVLVDTLAEANFSEKTWHDTAGNDISPADIVKVVEGGKARNNGVIDWGSLAEARPDLAYHMEKLERISYETPILLLGEHTIVDGVHRALKAWLEGVKEIKVKRFKDLPESAWLSPEAQEKLGKGQGS